MNKYQEALENIIVYPLKEDCENSPCCQCENQCDFYKMKLHDYYVLKELVDKATPKKVVKISQKDYIKGSYEHCCPSCSNCVGTILRDFEIEENDYCPTCGQALDWSEN